MRLTRGAAHVSRDMSLLVLLTLVWPLMVHARLGMVIRFHPADGLAMAANPRVAAILTIFSKRMDCFMVCAFVTVHGQLFVETLVSDFQFLSRGHLFRFLFGGKASARLGSGKQPFGRF